MGVRETIKDTLAESLPQVVTCFTAEADYEQVMSDAANKVYEALQDTLGVTQEKLLNDLAVARSDLRVAQANLETLRTGYETLYSEWNIATQQEKSEQSQH